MTTTMDNALEQLQTTFSVALLDSVVKAAYDPTNPNRAAANKALMAFQEMPDIWIKADEIIETSTNAETKFFGLQILDAAIQTRYVVYGRSV
jgi:exportin-1